MVATMRPGLNGRRLYLPRMNDCAAEAMAAAFRSVGIDAVVLPPSDARTLELGARYLAGEECLPAKITLGDFLKIIEGPDFDPTRTAFMLATANGPCRFGQYLPHIRKVLRTLGHPDVPVLSPTAEEGYQELGSLGSELARTGWRAIVASDILRKLLLKTRPYEAKQGETDAAYAVSLKALCATLERPARHPGDQLAALTSTLVQIRDRFRRIPGKYDRERLFIGIQGEIFCRLNDFSNEHLIRRLEACGGEAWLADISEWIWYCNTEQEDCLRNSWRRRLVAMLGAKVRDHIQHADEAALRAPFAEDFLGYAEPEHIDRFLRGADSYLPYESTSGEMVLSAAKVDYFFRKGVDGIIDISPFSCMNGIVSEALYPRASQEHAGLPIKNFYFDGKDRDVTCDLEVFLELARAYRERKPYARVYPACFEGGSRDGLCAVRA
jgi:predicted nucleotide-binding protein (sugar kinase/HSP70/actin superfamily)